MSAPRGPELSICIATYNRGKFISETLDSVLSQTLDDVEIIIVDGASQDNTPDVVASYVSRSERIRYFREQTNSGVDADYDKAVSYSRGKYCWLLTDDDLLCPGALTRVCSLLRRPRDLVVINSEIRTADLSKTLAKRALPFTHDKEYQAGQAGLLFSEIGDYLSFIGGFVVRREFWMTRDRASFYGSLFVHVGVAFQSPPVERAYVISEPLITIRYGNAMWSRRSFEIWMYKWPRLIWSFEHFSPREKSAVCSREPWKHTRRLLYYRGIGAYSMDEYERFLRSDARTLRRLCAFVIAFLPGWLSNSVAGLYCILRGKSWVSIYDLARSPHASWISRLGMLRLESCSSRATP